MSIKLKSPLQNDTHIKKKQIKLKAPLQTDTHKKEKERNKGRRKERTKGSLIIPSVLEDLDQIYLLFNANEKVIKNHFEKQFIKSNKCATTQVL